MFLGGDCGSLGIEMTGQRPVVYWVTRRPRADAAAEVDREMKAIAKTLADIAKIDKDEPGLELQTYNAGAAAGGTCVHRIVIIDDSKQRWCVDVAARGEQVLMAIAGDEGKFVERLLTLDGRR